MHKDFEIVKSACDFAGVIQTDAMVSVSESRLEAMNSHLMVSHPVKGLPDFSVPAVDLDFALRKVSDCTVAVSDSFVTLKSKIANTRIKRLPNRSPFKKPEIETTAIPDVVDLLTAIDDVFPFTVGDPAKPWSMGARIDARTITATNSVMLCQAELAQQAGFEGVTLSRTALAYIRLRGEALTRWGVSSRGILLEFDDGGWAMASRLAAEMPDMAVGLIERAVEPASWATLQKVSVEYRDALLASVDHTESILTVFPDHIYGARLASEHKCALDTKLGPGVEKAMFTAKDLTTVIMKADAIGFDKYPAPVPFKTKRGSRGLIAGRSS